MTLAEFKASMKQAKPLASLAPALAALWWAGKKEWDKAHRIVMNEGGKDCAWVHAYLHRREGDLDNAVLVSAGRTFGGYRLTCRGMDEDRSCAPRVRGRVSNPPSCNMRVLVGGSRP